MSGAYRFSDAILFSLLLNYNALFVQILWMKFYCTSLPYILYYSIWSVSWTTNIMTLFWIQPSIFHGTNAILVQLKLLKPTETCFSTTKLRLHLFQSTNGRHQFFKMYFTTSNTANIQYKRLCKVILEQDYSLYFSIFKTVKAMEHVLPNRR